MLKVRVLLVLLAMVMVAAVPAAAADIYFTGSDTGDGLWQTDANWDGGAKPGAADDASIRFGPGLVSGPTVVSGDNFSIGRLYIGHFPTVPGSTLTMTGGTITFSNSPTVGINSAVGGNVLTMSGSSVIKLTGAATDFYFGDRAEATLNMYDNALLDTTPRRFYWSRTLLGAGAPSHGSLSNLRVNVYSGTIKCGGYAAQACTLINSTYFDSRMDIQGTGKVVMLDGLGFPSAVEMKTAIDAGFVTASLPGEELRLVRQLTTVWNQTISTLEIAPPTPGKNVLFGDDFERDGGATGRIFTVAQGAPAEKAWDSESFLSDLSTGGITTASVQTGLAGLEIISPGSTARRLVKNLTVSGQKTLIFEFDMQLKDISDSTGSYLQVFNTHMGGLGQPGGTLNGASNEIYLEIDVDNPVGTNTMRLSGKNDANATTSTQLTGSVVEENIWYHIRITHVAADAGMTNGSRTLEYWKVSIPDVITTQTISNIDNDLQDDIQELRLGAAGNVGGLAGSLYFDNFQMSTPAAVLTMAAAPVAGGTTTPAAGTSTVPLNVAQAITASANAGYAFVNWTASPAANATFGDASAASTTVTLTGSCTVTANFKAVVDLTMAVAPVGGGTTTPTGTTTVDQGVAQPITASASAGYAFVNWTFSPAGSATFGDDTLAATTVTLSADCTVTANFATTLEIGDFNGDGVFNSLDIPDFKAALSNKDAWESATGRDADALGDFNDDGVFNSLDIPGFKAGLAG